MKHWWVLFRVTILAVAGAICGFAFAQEPAGKAAAGKPMADLSWLVGGVWVADASKMAPGMRRIETSYQWSDNDSFLRFTTHFVSDKGTAKTYDGNLYWDASKNSYAIWYMDARNSITEGPMLWDGHRLVVSFRALDFEGKMADMKVDVTRASDHRYHWALSEKLNDGWKELAALDYERAHAN